MLSVLVYAVGITAASVFLGNWLRMLREYFGQENLKPLSTFSHATHNNVTVRHVKYNRRS